MMLRKAVTGLAAVLAFGAVSAASALDMSAGLSLGFASDFGGQGMTDGDNTITTPFMGFAFNAFFDATYAEVDVGMTFASGKQKRAIGGETETDDKSFGATLLNLGLLLKYPIAISDAFSIAPAAGVDYALCIGTSYDGEAIKEEGGYKHADNSQLWVKFGAVTDFALTEQIYLRPALLYGIGFASKNTSDQVKAYKDAGADDLKATLSHGLTVKVGVGYKF